MRCALEQKDGQESQKTNEMRNTNTEKGQMIETKESKYKWGNLWNRRVAKNQNTNELLKKGHG